MREKLDLRDFAAKEGLLSGVWFDKSSFKPYDWSEEEESRNVCYFMWQGQIYMAAEDPNDGYRSSLAFVEVCPDLFPASVWEPSERCETRYRESTEYPEDTWRSPERCSIVEFVSVITGKIVLEIGTTNTDDYYPSCVLHFDPRNMSHNQPEIDLIGRGKRN